MNAPLTHHPAPVREYRDAARLIADARELKRRMWAPTGIAERVEPAPAPRPAPALIVVPRRARAVIKSGEFGPWPAEDPRNLVNTPGNAREIIRAVCVATGVSWGEIMGDRRIKHIAHARQEAMYEIRMRLGWSLPRIGALFGRDHTTAHHAIRAVRRRRLDGEARS